MNVITIEEDAFYSLLEEVMVRLTKKRGDAKEKWISGEEAMKKLRIKSKTTLQKYRDEGRIRFSQPDKKIILYDLDSIDDFISKNAKDTF